MTLLLPLVGRASACSLLGPQPFEVVEDPTDTVAPTPPELVSLDVKRGRGSVGGGVTSCDDLGWISLELARPAGDPDAEDAVGYLVELAAGDLPEGLVLPVDPVRSDLVFAWGDGATRTQEPLSFVLAVSPVDAAGNVGDPLEVGVEDPGSAGGGCDATGGSGWGLGAVLALLALRRR